MEDSSLHLKLEERKGIVHAEILSGFCRISPLEFFLN